jgi:predicted ATPase/class 3 adenylate cyclase
MSARPSGTVTFLFTDIEGSTRLAQSHRDSWEALRQRHHEILAQGFDAENGFTFQIIGDAFCVAFDNPGDAIRAAVRAQRALTAEPWGETPVRVRMGIHTGQAREQNGEYTGYLAMSSVQRVMSAAHGGQVLVSQSAFELVQDDMPEGVASRDLGQHRLKDLQRPRHIFQLIIPGLPTDFPAIKTLDVHPHNLPIELNSFVGREQEIEEIGKLLQGSRLVTLTGVGGTGKTRLAVHAAAEILADFGDGAWLVELAPVSDPALVAQAIGAAMAVPEQPGRPYMEVLTERLSTRMLLLLLDNCEHLIDSCAQVAQGLLLGAPQLRILATSREALAISGEAAFPVRSLPLPSAAKVTAAELADSDAIRLFCDRAAAASPGFALDNGNATDVARICQRLDGIPLALELAAPLVKGLHASQIADQLDHRFRLLTGGSRTALPRQRTLQAAIDWSYKLLDDDERLLLRRLSVFQGGWSLEAAVAVCGTEGLDPGAILQLLLRLVDKSLVVSETTSSPSRYYMLETIRQFAQDRLEESGEAVPARRRHAEWLVDWAESMARELHGGPTQVQRFAELETEPGNIEAALVWALQGGDKDLGLRLGGAILYFWWRGGHWFEWERWMKLAAGNLEGASGSALAAAHLALGAGYLYVQRDPQQGQRHIERALALYQELGDRFNTAWSLMWLATLSYANLTDPEVYERFAAKMHEALAVFEALDSKPGIAQALTNLGLGKHLHGDLIGARAAHEQSLAIARQIGDVTREEIQLSNLGSVALESGDLETAQRLYKMSLSATWERRNFPNLVNALANFEDVYEKRGDAARSAMILGAMDAVTEAPGVRLQPITQQGVDAATARVKDKLGQAQFELLRKEGRQLTPEQAVRLAMGDEKI